MAELTSYGSNPQVQVVEGASGPGGVALTTNFKNIVDAIEDNKAEADASISTLTDGLSTKADAATTTAALATKANSADVTAALATKADASALTSHTSNTTNPHSVTAAQTGAYTTTQVDNALALKANSTHGHAIGDTTGLQGELDAKADANHVHNATDISGLAIGDVDGLQTALDGKSTTGHGHAISDVTNLQTTLDSKSGTDHTHSNATTGAAGFMSAADKTKLDGATSEAYGNSLMKRDANGSTTLAAVNGIIGPPMEDGSLLTIAAGEGGPSQGIYPGGSGGLLELFGGAPGDGSPTGTIGNVNIKGTEILLQKADGSSVLAASGSGVAITGGLTVDGTNIVTTLNGKAAANHTHGLNTTFGAGETTITVGTESLLESGNTFVYPTLTGAYDNDSEGVGSGLAIGSPTSPVHLLNGTPLKLKRVDGEGQEIEATVQQTNTGGLLVTTVAEGAKLSINGKAGIYTQTDSQYGNPYAETKYIHLSGSWQDAATAVILGGCTFGDTGYSLIVVAFDGQFVIHSSTGDVAAFRFAGSFHSASGSFTWLEEPVIVRHSNNGNITLAISSPDARMIQFELGWATENEILKYAGHIRATKIEYYHP